MCRHCEEIRIETDTIANYARSGNCWLIRDKGNGEWSLCADNVLALDNCEHCPWCGRELTTNKTAQDFNFDIWEKNGIKSKLANVLIAPEDYVEGDKRYFTFDEACGIEAKLKNGWRLPTRHEWVLICEEYGVDEDGDLSYSKLHETLGLGLNGFVNPWTQQLRDVGAVGDYWSSTAPAATHGFGLGFNASGVYPSNSNARANGFSVRLVKDLKDKIARRSYE